MTGDMEGECWGTRELLWPILAGRARRDEEEARAWEHLRRCEACQGYFARDARMAGHIRKSGLSGEAPPELKARIREALDREDAGAGARERREAASAAGEGRPSPGGTRRHGGGPGGLLRSRRALVAAAAMVALVVAAAVSEVQVRTGPDLLSQYVAADYLQRAHQEVGLYVDDPVHVRAFFEERMGLSFDPTALADARLEGAILCWLRGKPAAMVLYEMAGQKVAHYRLRMDDAAHAAGPPGLWTDTRDGVGLARWADEDVVHALVAEKPAGDLARLARENFGVR